MLQTIPEIPIPHPDAGKEYGELSAAQIAQDTAKIYARYQQWEAAGTVPQPDGTELGTGRFSTVEAAGDLAIRTPRDPALVDEYVRNMVRGLGAPCLEQLVAASSQRVYSGRVTGSGKLHTRSQHLRQLQRLDIDLSLNALTILQARGLGIDDTGDNIRLVPGVAFIDFDIRPWQPLYAQAGFLATAIGKNGLQTFQQRGELPYQIEVSGRIQPLRLLATAVEDRARRAPGFWEASVEPVRQLVRWAEDIGGR